MNTRDILAALALALWALACGACRPSNTDETREAVVATTNDQGSEPVKEPTDLKTKLTPLQYRVTQQCGTEPPFDNAYWDNHAEGLYVDVIDGTPLFSSTHKFDSGSGWPSFTQPLEGQALSEKSDRTHGMVRTEVRSAKADSHLGHVFDDGPGPNGLRYCINSASLRFVPVERLEAEGLGQYLHLFGRKPTGATPQDTATTEVALLAGGCFWGMEDLLRKIPGVIETECGYTGGHLENPRYEDTHDSKSGHAEAVRVVFDPRKLSYESLLGWFFRMHDPTTLNRQGNDVGTQYRSAIFYTTPEQQAVAERVKASVDKSGKWKRPVVTEISAAGKWWAAEGYHQDYLVRNPDGYTCHYLRD